jgi:PKD repeat protein
LASFAFPVRRPKVKDVRDKVRMVRAFVGLAMVVFLLLLLTGCWLFNVAPVASFTASTLSGTVPLTVSFSAILSYDSDGIITVFAWDFGDGSSGSGESVSHTFTTEGTRTVVLRVTDEDGARATAQKVITVLPPEEDGDGGGAGPTASFTATPLTGAAPLTVTFNASASAYAGHAITAYFWDFGDGTTGSGMTTTHTYAPSATTTYHVVLRIIASDNTEDTATKDITATRTTPAPPSTAPTASFTANPTTETAPANIAFDPDASTAAAGRTLTTYFWSFGDGTSRTEVTDVVVNHTYTTSLTSKDFTVVLTVIDDLGSTGSYSRTVTVNNRKPITGFEMSDDGGATWDVEDITINGAGTAVQTVSFRSLNPNWSALADPADRPNEGSTKPANFETGAYTSGDRNLSYDPEGQWIASDGWGLVNYRWDMGDGVVFVNAANPDDTDVDYTDSGGYNAFSHNYQLTGSEDSKIFEVKLQVMDEQGQWSDVLTRKVKLFKV